MHAEEDNFKVFPRTRYNKSNIPDNFMSSQLWKECIYRIIQYFETKIENKDDLDNGHEELTKSVIGEMDKYLRLLDTSKEIRKKLNATSPTDVKN